MRNRRHITASILALACLCLGLCGGCPALSNYFWSPEADPNERWVSEDPEMYFTWSEEAGGHWGEITIHETTTDVLVLFDYGTGMVVAEYDPAAEIIGDEATLFRCDCKFGEDTLVATVTRDDKNVFDGELPTFTFEREEIQEDTGAE